MSNEYLQNDEACVFQRNSKFRLLCLVNFDTILQASNRKREGVLLHAGYCHSLLHRKIFSDGSRRGVPATGQ